MRSIREAVVNSFAHMRYETQPFNEIYLTPSRICISNPGPMPYGSDPLEFAEGRTQSILRNPLIAEVLYYEGTIDRFGTGFRRIFDECDRSGVRYSYDNSDIGFRFCFMRSSIPQAAQAPEMTEDEQELVEMMAKDPSVTLKELSELAGMTPGQVNGIVKRLREKGIVERVGARKNGRWIVKAHLRRHPSYTPKPSHRL